MIETFVINNYKSIKDLLVIDFTNKKQIIKENQQNLFKDFAGNKISRLNFLYGKNGSGKTTIIEALKVFQELVLSSKDVNSKRGRRTLDVVPFKIVEKVDDNTFFSLIFYSENEKYRFSIMYNSKTNTITDEILEHLTYDKQIIYAKEDQVFTFLSEIEKDRLATYKFTKQTILATLYEEFNLANKTLHKHIENVYLFFNSISFSFLNVNNKKSLAHLVDNKEYINMIIKQLRKFDLTIEDLVINAREVSFQEYKKRYSALLEEGLSEAFYDSLIERYEDAKVEYDLNVIHNKKPLDFKEESAGTQMIINILFSLYASNKKIWLIDDFEHDLHKEATMQIVKYLANNLLDLQFVFITHELEFLNIEEIHNKALHYFVIRDEKDLATTVVYLSQFADLRSDERNNWELFYRKFRLAQYPKITVND